MNTRFLITISAFALVYSSCATMENSKADRQMKFQGSFTCDSVSNEGSHPDKTLAEKDVARVRCARDEWKVRPDTIIYTRTLFMSEHCDTLLGKFSFQAPYTNDGKKLTLTHPECKITRVSNGWLAENSGKCMIKTLELGKPYSLHAHYPCSNYVPSYCQKSVESLDIEAVIDAAKTSHDPYDTLTFTAQPSGKQITCKRYAGE